MGPNFPARPDASPLDHGPARHGRAGRVRGFDAIRGLAVLSMVAFHLCYDLAYIRGLALPWFHGLGQDVWRASISWTFLAVAGCMCAFSRNNLRRSCRYLAVALLIFVVTSVVAIDVPISFGIIYCMGASTLAYELVARAGIFPRSPVGLVAAFAMLLLAFVLCLGLPAGTVGMGAATMALPQDLYDSGLLSWLGFPSPAFASGDYYPLLPYGLLYLAGAALGRLMRLGGVPTWLRGLCCPPLELVGRHALAVYVIHQPVLLLVAGVL